MGPAGLFRESHLGAPYPASITTDVWAAFAELNALLASSHAAISGGE